MKSGYRMGVVAGMLLLAGGVSAAEPGKGYVGAQYGWVTYSETGVPDYNPQAMLVRGGYNFSQYLSVEGRIGFGVSSDTKSVFGVDIKLDLDNIYGVYAIGRLPLSKQFDLYGVAGFTQGSLTATGVVSGVSVSDDDNDLSFGIGAEFLMQRVSFTLEYMSYMRKSDFDISAMAVGVNVYF